MFKRTKLSSLLILLVGAMILTACQSGSGDTTNTPTGPVTLQWWGAFWPENVVSSLIQEYQTQNPNVKIQYANKWPGGSRDVASKLYQDELDRVLRDRNAAAIPDIFMVENTWVGNYESFTAPAPSSVIDIDTVKTAFYPVVAKDFAKGDVVRGLPLWMDTLAVLYNKEILSSNAISTPPEDWVDFRNLAFALTNKSGSTITRSGFAAGVSSNVSFGTELMNLLFLQNEVTMVDSQGNPSFATDSDASVALEFFQDFAKSTGSWNDKLKNDALAFLEEDVAMIVAPAWRLHDILSFNKKYSLGLDIGIAPMPQLQSQTQPRINWATYWGNMVALDRPNATESWKFLRWLSEPAQLRKLRANELLGREFFGFLYPRVDMQQELQADPYLRVYNSALPTAESWYMVDGLAVKEIFKEMLSTSGGSTDIASANGKVQQVVTNKGKL